VYLMSLGDFTAGFDSEFGDVVPGYVWFLFILSTLFIMIIMLNLLIAIISEAFNRIYAVSEEAAYQEAATIIAENSYLIPDHRKHSYCEENKYLLLAIDVEQEMKTLSDPLQ